MQCPGQTEGGLEGHDPGRCLAVSDAGVEVLPVLQTEFDRREAGHHAVHFGSLALVDVRDVELVIDIVLGALV